MSFVKCNIECRPLQWIVLIDTPNHCNYNKFYCICINRMFNLYIYFAKLVVLIFMKIDRWKISLEQNAMAFRAIAIQFQNKTKSNKAYIWQKKRPREHIEHRERKKPTDIDIILGSFKAGCWSLLRILLVRMRVWKAVDWSIDLCCIIIESLFDLNALNHRSIFMLIVATDKDKK